MNKRGCERFEEKQEARGVRHVGDAQGDSSIGKGKDQEEEIEEEVLVGERLETNTSQELANSMEYQAEPMDDFMLRNENFLHLKQNTR